MTKEKLTMRQRFKRLVSRLFGKDSPGAKADEAVKRSKAVRKRAESLCGVGIVLAALAASGCNALGLTPRADAPAYSGVGVLVVGSENEARILGRTDQSGAVGASGSAEQTAEVPAEAVEAMIGAAQALISAGKPEAAAAVLGALTPAPKGGKGPKTPEAPKPAEADPAAPAEPPAIVPAPTGT